jgi:hypothetical protein
MLRWGGRSTPLVVLEKAGIPSEDEGLAVKDTLVISEQ